MELSAFEIALFTGILGVGATLLGVIISYGLSLRLTKKQERRVAGAKLRAAFAEEIANYTLFKLQKINGINLSGALLKHAPAVEEYRVFVPRHSRDDYQKAWECYYECFAENMKCGQPAEDNKIYIERIEAILKFTEPG